MAYEKEMEYIKTNIPDFRKRLLNVLKIYQLDIFTTRKNNRIYTECMWEVIKTLKYGLDNPVPIEGGDYFDWAIGSLTNMFERKSTAEKVSASKKV